MRGYGLDILIYRCVFSVDDRMKLIGLRTFGCFLTDSGSLIEFQYSKLTSSSGGTARDHIYEQFDVLFS